ncbi:hypothetical protein [Pseudomonas sp. B22129]|uniref:YncE family protein n=1 Tax=Pseudomonas sp. B22129 TaxID=3235111 RepID=UPI003784BD0C
MTTPTSPGADVSLDSPEASFETQLGSTPPTPEVADKGEGIRGLEPDAWFWLEAWFRIAIGDEYSMFVNGREVAKNKVGSLTNRYSLRVASSDMPNGVVTTYAMVKRIGSGQLSFSPLVTYLNKRDTPGGIDRIVDDRGHSGLTVVAENLPQFSSIGRDVLTNGLWALISAYANRRVNDRITTFFAGVPTYKTLTPADIAGPWPLRMFIPPSVIAQAADVEEPVLITTVIDVVNNTPAGPDKFSAPYILYNSLIPGLFLPPLLLINNLDVDRVNWAIHGTLLFSIEAVPDRAIRPGQGNQIVVTAILTDLNNKKQTVRLPAKAHQNVRGEIIDATALKSSLLQLAQNGGGFLAISFELLDSTGRQIGRSGRNSYPILAVQLPTTYPAPEFNNVAGPQTVNTQNYPNGANVRVAFANMNAAQTIRLSAVLANGSSVVLGTVTGSSTGAVSLLFSAQLLTQAAGQLVKLIYEVTEGGITTPSLAQELTVQAQSGGVSPTVAVGLGPHAISVTRDGQKAFVPCRDSNSISVLDTLTRRVITTIFGVSSPFGSVLSPDDSRLYVGSFLGGCYYVISTTTYQILKTVPLTGGGNVSALALTEDGARLFVACTNTGVVHVYETAMNTNINRIPTASAPFGLTVNPEQTQVWIAFQSAVGIINANGYGGLLAKIPGVGRTVHIAFNPGNLPVARAYVADESGISVVNPLTNAIVGNKIMVPNAWGLALNTNAPELWVSGSDPGAVGASAYRSSVYVIDTNTLQVTKRHTGFGNAANMAFVPNSRVALVANQATGQVSFVPT